VTDRADWEARQLVRRAKRLSPQAKVLVTGCYAQVNPQDVARVPGVDYVVGLNRLDDLLAFVAAAPNGEGVRIAVSDVKRERAVSVLGTRALPGHTRAFLKIQEGCNFSCAYCIIPTARGLSRSVRAGEVLDQVRRLADAGYIEIVLTGIHLGSYGHDLTPKLDLTTLVEMIVESGLVRRVRLSSLDPREVNGRLIDLMAASNIVCPHLHICAQAGDDEILKRMRRNYDTRYYRDLLMEIRERLPDAALGSDIIVGFPGETDAGFERSLEYFAALPLTYFHVFPYSTRRGTAAASLPEPVPALLKKTRAQKMRQLGREKKNAFCHSFIGRRVSVLIEGKRDKRTGCHRGFSRNYLPVAVRAGESRVNREMPVTLDSFDGEWLRGMAIGDRSGSDGHATHS
jgi:threonylcarbamoyladenosine tRNA methylthiotransferase MtaB